MKLARCSAAGKSDSWAVVDLDRQRATPLRGELSDWAPDARNGDVRDWVQPDKSFPLGDARFLSPASPTAKVICAGLNYRSHVEAFGKTMPDTLIAFVKAPTAVIAHDDPIVYPALTQKLDYEIELVAVMAEAVHPSAPPSMSVLGFTIGNDVTARDLSQGPRGTDLYSSKSLDDTCGTGPWIVTADEIGAIPDLRMILRVNGEVRQDDRTSKMEWNVDELLRYVNARTRLLPGDLVFTGTPAGVALEDGRFLRVDDVVEAEIEHIGVLRNRVCAPAKQ